ncbi:hypothetical protein N7519_008682 [Penicillium mononematosum]|uniref:uncharacterized protein n=1 Tax=Penicillium mononematosum TaxID=268346 RepID=UPI0025476263|nr:uncharacterized protein N7519_008682 [Penicillium mononematosum]KAJ6178221.1 hypothetical protein N7519_008682 [Penicillium mononematosum]
MLTFQLLSQPGKAEGITGFTDKIAGKATYQRAESAKARCAPPAIASFAGAKRGDGGKLLSCLLYAQAIATRAVLGKV